MKHYGRIKKGKLELLDEQRFIDDLIALDGVDIVLTVSENKDFRTNSQNKLYWKICTILGDEIGYTKQETHDIIKTKFLQRERIEDGRKIKYLKSTTQLTKKEFTKLVNDITIWVAQTFSISLPYE